MHKTNVNVLSHITERFVQNKPLEIGVIILADFHPVKNRSLNINNNTTMITGGIFSLFLQIGKETNPSIPTSELRYICVSTISQQYLMT
jgi:hypothetical protein